MQLKSKIQRDYAILFKSSKKNPSVTTVSLLLRYLMGRKVYLSSSQVRLRKHLFSTKILQIWLLKFWIPLSNSFIVLK